MVWVVIFACVRVGLGWLDCAILAMDFVGSSSLNVCIPELY